MMLYGAFTDVERSSNLFVASTMSQILQNLRFSPRKFKEELYCLHLWQPLEEELPRRERARCDLRPRKKGAFRA